MSSLVQLLQTARSPMSPPLALHGLPPPPLHPHLAPPPPPHPHLAPPPPPRLHLAPHPDLPHRQAGAATTPTTPVCEERRFVTMVERHRRCVSHRLRRLGVSSLELDDALQQVLWTALRKLECIRAGSERAFLLKTAVRVASNWRRERKRRRSVPYCEAEHAVPVADSVPSVDELLDLRYARTLLDQVLAEIPARFRTVFVLSELDEITMAEIAVMLRIPSGTVASRLRRARELFGIACGLSCPL